MAKRLDIGVIGLGRIGYNFHCRRLHEHRRFNLAAVADPLTERLKEAQAAFGCRGFERPEDLLTLRGLDAVVVASPTHVHKAQTVAAFQRRLHVILEKPMAMDLGEARAIVRAAKKARRKLTVYQPHRAADYFQHLKRILATGKIGEVYHVRRGMFRYVQRDDWQSLRKFGGGMLNNYGAHALDQVLHVTGNDVKRVFAQLRLVASLGDAEDVVKVLYETRSGTLGEVEINQASAAAPYEMQVWGTLGTVMYRDRTLELRYVRGGRLPKKELNASLASAGRRYPSDRIDFVEQTIPVNERYQVDFHGNFARAIQERRELLVKPEETLAVMKVMAACRKSAGRIRRNPAKG